MLGFDDMFEKALNTPHNLTLLELSSLGFIHQQLEMICTGCALAHFHDEHKAWFKCIDAASNPGQEWPAVFKGDKPVACARKETNDEQLE